MKRCLVIGGNGFIGSHVCERLLELGHEVVAFDVARDFSAFKSLHNPRLHTVTGDFLNRAEVKAALEGIDWVFHLATTTTPATSNQNIVFDIQSNVIASIELFEEAVSAGVERVLFASSGGTVYGRPPVNPVPEDVHHDPLVSYGVTKLMVEKYGALFEALAGLKVIALRIANPYGPRHRSATQGVIPIFIRRLLAGKSLQIWGDGSIVRDYIYIDDVAEAFCRAAVYDGPERVFNIGSGRGISLNALVEHLARLSGRPPEVEYFPARSFDVPEIVLDISRAVRELRWRPEVSLEEGLLRTWEWYRKNSL
ncbi:NAD-dependent epimerase/dehydratase family protein [Methylothermus subterraneus]